ncbi:MAG TPA: NAD(P)-dependent oxidoreductase [Thauera sp.]|uniref:NAD(P)-dependent oxidoreductase n=1 Tax=Thauera sp. 28 TaxID=303682 RepID=UPI0002CF472F|nr:NAD(P)-dependent oxidoreductase [Thauera sp. 28]HNR61434.1 NAD(P)-dependent oxidoreductase [Thauera sp.]ENO91223.1 2-hydroxy-3-oxopropionate reductase [Thauera sp. 28]HNS92401.1 NAD(P)-dependent oxidoreductase [Thauera sp.]HRJ25285.1 NAD(P)-dependent oxidoreductase [Thauera sp.]HRK12218.1 NAD(P)-dependent oxidoreductase [Thauera sp.]
MEVGFIGLGLMGRPMALNLIKAGHRVHVWSRRRASMEPLLAAGAGDCESAADVARRAAVTISMVADAPDVEQVTLGPAGVAEAAGAGHIHIDMSTIAPAAAQSIAARLAARGVTALDAPVSGGEVGAIAGSLTIMAGGDADAFARVLPLLEAMGRSITRIGDAGAGQVAKACNQILTGVGVAAVAEALNFATRSGVDAGRVREALLGGFAYSRILENHGQRMLERNFKPGFKAWMHQKDMRIVMEEAHRLGLALPSAAATTQLFNAMVGSGLGEDDSVAVLKLLERMSGAAAE